MGKRKIQLDVTSDSDFSPEEEEYPRKKKATTGSRKKNKDKHVSNEPDSGITIAEGSADLQPPHPISQHTISAPSDIRVALLRWFSDVHDTRGMPWRKPHNPNLDPDQRSQRAYEVCAMPFRSLVKT
jgi:A/G-specific adenine glycosylase